MLSLCKGFCFLSIGVFFCFLSYGAYTIRPKLEVTLANADRTIIIAGAAATHLEKASGTWEKSSKQQSEQTTKAMERVSAAAERLTVLVSRTDDSLNSALIPAVTKAISEQNASLLDSEKLLQGNLQESQKVLSDADQRITEPAITNSLASIEEASKNAAESTKQVQLALTDVRQMADKARETYLKPVNLWWGAIKTLLPLAGSAAQVIK